MKLFFRGGLRILSHIDIASNLVDCFENSGIVLGNVGEVWSSILGSATSLPTVKSLGELTTTTTTMSNHVVVSQSVSHLEENPGFSFSHDRTEPIICVTYFSRHR